MKTLLYPADKEGLSVAELRFVLARRGYPRAICMNIKGKDLRNLQFVKF
jgi:hypothetical protein